MKCVNLINMKGAGYTTFNYSGLLSEDLAPELERRGIVIEGTPHIKDKVTIGNEVKIGRSCFIEEAVIIHSRANLVGCNVIGLGSIIGEGAMLDYEVRLPIEGKVMPGSWIAHSLQIRGSRHPLHYSGRNYLSIGCMTMLISDWQSKYELVGATEMYTKAQVEEYAKYINLYADLYAANKGWDKSDKL